MSFADLTSPASGKHAFGSRKDDAFSVTASASMLFATPNQAAGEDGDLSEYTPDFGPVAENLPPKVEVKTGEENQEVLFQERSKIFRFHEETNQWKERGIGEIKILHHAEMNFYRV